MAVQVFCWVVLFAVDIADMDAGLMDRYVRRLRIRSAAVIGDGKGGTVDIGGSVRVTGFRSGRVPTISPDVGRDGPVKDQGSGKAVQRARECVTPESECCRRWKVAGNPSPLVANTPLPLVAA